MKNIGKIRNLDPYPSRLLVQRAVRSAVSQDAIFKLYGLNERFFMRASDIWEPVLRALRVRCNPPQ